VHSAQSMPAIGTSMVFKAVMRDIITQNSPDFG